MNSNEDPKNPFLSIILCTYNGQNYLKQQLDSLLAQSYDHFEVVALDDRSQDETYAILCSYAEKDKRIVAEQNNQQLGLNQNFEKGIRKAKGSYLLICDQDDVWMPNKLEELVSNLNGSLLYFHNSNYMDADDRLLGKTLSDKFRMRSNPHPLAFLLLNSITGHTCMFDRSLIDRNLLPFPSMVYYDNWVGFIASLNGSCTYIDRCLVNYRMHGKNFAASKRKPKRLNAALRLQFQKHMIAFGNAFPDNSPTRQWLLRIAKTYETQSMRNNLTRGLLLASNFRLLTQFRKKNQLHSLALCIKMAYKPLPNHMPQA
ncbi:MAG: glycosyltransferase [Bacteroidales bacterium]|nr:glycosyltransferase [Bacteroidales bacterium]MDD4770961.1 glycosyltransferase [Bacteroidales bacterium]